MAPTKTATKKETIKKIRKETNEKMVETSNKA
jgi:hypothetical protein